MKRVAYDIEADGFLDDWTDHKYTQVHCIVLRDIDTGEVRCYHEAEHITPRHGGLLDALVVLSQADLRVAHNGLGYDEVVLRGNPETTRFSCLYLQKGILIAIDAVNAPKDFVQSKALIANRVRIDPEQACDVSVALKDLG